MQHLRKLFFVALATLALGFAFSTSQVAFAQAVEDDVIINEFSVNSTGGREYTELLVTKPGGVNMQGWTLSDVGTRAGGTSTTEGDVTLPAAATYLANVPQGTFVVIVYTTGAATNILAEDTSTTDGNRKLVLIAGTTAGLTLAGTIDNSTTENLQLYAGTRAAGTLIDQVLVSTNTSYITGATWGDNNGTTTSDNIASTPSNSVARFVPTSDTLAGYKDNDTGARFVVDTSSYGTPGAANAGIPGEVTFIAPLKISEFRTFGPTGTCDEFVEIYNASNTPYTVQSIDNSLGFAVAQSNGNVLFIIENTKVIPARGHYLAVNNGGGGCTGSFSGSAYPAGSPSATATGDDTMNEDIPTNAGIALFNTSNQGSFNTDTRLDAVGPSTLPVGSLYVEGTGYPPINPAAPNIANHSLFRDARSGLPKDTNNNETDFLVVDTNGATICTDTANFVCQRLGAPGPENTSSPVQRNDLIKASLVDTQCSSISVNPTLPSACRFERRSTPGGSPSSFGTLSIRRRFTNNTQQPTTRLRFRIVDITTLPEGQVPGNGIADLRAITSTSVSATCQSEGGTPHLCTDNATPTTTIEGTTLETDANGQPNGGAYNSTLSLATPLAAGASINVQFLLGVERNGFFRFFVNVEALPAPAGAALTDGAAVKSRAAGKAARAAKGSN
jgi:hypothetical protein